MIVRDVPDIDAVRAGIRHHHERWDGAGYLDCLAGAQIPLIARILAVGDAFSAMTTTRPYRKALDVREALTRLGDAAGSQLDGDLVRAFIEGIETASDAPLPGVDRPAVDRPAADLRRPGRRVA
jgi:HD-GYP domain-containing protein (c-di-GMP phosphodiesterase class II)